MKPQAKAGRPPFRPSQKDRDLVKIMVAAGIEHEVIARCIINPGTGKPITPKTMRRHFRAEIDTAATLANAKVAAALYTTATSGKGQAAVTAAIWWTKTRMGWKSSETIEHTQPPGESFRHADVSELSDAERVARLASLLDRARDRRDRRDHQGGQGGEAVGADPGASGPSG